MEPADHVVGFRPSHAVLTAAVSRVVLALLEAQTGKANIEIANPGRRGQRDHIGQTADERGRGQIELGISRSVPTNGVALVYYIGISASIKRFRKIEQHLAGLGMQNAN